MSGLPTVVWRTRLTIGVDFGSAPAARAIGLAPADSASRNKLHHIARTSVSDRAAATPPKAWTSGVPNAAA